jgi:uncharacterized membrane protein YjgN (DUF898 family)
MDAISSVIKVFVFVAILGLFAMAIASPVFFILAAVFSISVFVRMVFFGGDPVGQLVRCRGWSRAIVFVPYLLALGILLVFFGAIFAGLDSCQDDVGCDPDVLFIPFIFSVFLFYLATFLLELILWLKFVGRG